MNTRSREVDLGGRCEQHVGEVFPPRCAACAAAGDDESAAQHAEAAARDAVLAASELRAGRMRSASAHLGLATDALATAAVEARCSAAVTR